MARFRLPQFQDQWIPLIAGGFLVYLLIAPRLGAGQSPMLPTQGRTLRLPVFVDPQMDPGTQDPLSLDWLPDGSGNPNPGDDPFDPASILDPAGGAVQFPATSPDPNKVSQATGGFAGF